MLNFLLGFFTQYGYASVFLVLLLCGFGLPIPEDITLVSAGIIAALGHANVKIMFALSLTGVLLGDGMIFFAGRYYGEKILKVKIIARIMTPRRFKMVQEKFEKYGKMVIFMARFMPGLRAPIYLSAGISKKVSPFRFFLLDGIAALVSVPIWVYAGYHGANNLEKLMKMVKRGQKGTIILTLVGIGIFIAIKSWQGRKVIVENSDIDEKKP